MSRWVARQPGRAGAKDRRLLAGQAVIAASAGRRTDHGPSAIGNSASRQHSAPPVIDAQLPRRMRLALLRHQDSRGDATQGVEVEVAWAGPGRLRLTYVVRGDIMALRLPEVGPHVRADDLWRHTCFEVFIRTDNAVGYHEFNISPSGAWAAYVFDGYRSGIRNEDVAAPTTARGVEAGVFRLDVEIELPATLSRQQPWNLALTAVIEETAGAMSYWALAHPPGRADFHHADGFSFRVTPAERA